MSIFRRQNQPVVSIFTTSEGHFSLAQATQQGLQSNLLTHFNLVQGKEFSLYTPFYLFFPQLFKIPFKLSSTTTIKKISNSFSKISYQEKISKIISSQKPKVVISSFYMHNFILEKEMKKLHFPLYNIIANPRTFSSLELSPYAYNLVFDSQAAEECLRLGVSPEKIITTGWFVRDQFEQKYNQKQIRQQLGLDPDTLTLLMVTGSEGTNTILKNFPALINPKKPVQVIFACGKNKALFSTVKTLSKAIKATNPKTLAKIIPLAFTKEIHLYLQAADLVIGKAGPNLLFESVATLTPFLATTHVSGQEDGNLDIIKEYQLGYVEENLTRSVKLIKKIINHPQTLKHFQPHLKKMAQYNRNSKKILHQHINKNLKTSS